MPKSDKPMLGWEALDLVKQKGRTRAGKPLRSIRESMVNRGAGQRGAASYLSRAKPAPKVGALKSLAKTAGRVGSRFAGPVGVALTAYDAYDTARTIKETVGAARELGRVRAKGRAAERGTAAIQKAMRAKYPLAGTQYTPTKEDRAHFKANPTVKIPKGKRLGRSGTIGGINIE